LDFDFESRGTRIEDDSGGMLMASPLHGVAVPHLYFLRFLSSMRALRL
jgi:hypothetical protein